MGWTVTDNEDVLQRAESGEDWVKQADKTSLLGRIARPSDIAHAVVFLLDDRTHTTGSVMDMHTEYVPGMLGGGIGKASDVDASNDE
jgi:NAD(P)-dependent dehydrogenase (short-subunit alcohol dehydrogenase family)